MTRKRALFIATGIVGVALFVQSLRTVGRDGVTEGLARVGWGFGAILLVSGAREAVRALAWVRTVEGPAPLSFAQAIRARLAGEALNTLLPMGVLVGEPVKASHVAPHLPFATAFRGLVVEFAFYCISLVLLLGSGLIALVAGANRSPDPYAVALLAVLIAALGAGFWFVRRTGARDATHASMSGEPGEGIRAAVAGAIAGVHRQSAIVVGFAAEHPERVRPIVGFEIAYQALAVVEVYCTLLLISPVRPTFTAALVMETVNRTITMIFKMLPMRVGVDEASASLFAGHLDLGAATGVTLALVRKLRMLFWSAVGLALLMRRSTRSTRTLPLHAVGQRVL